MAITPRTIFSSPASATVATVALLAFSAVGTLAYQVAHRTSPSTHRLASAQASGACQSILTIIGPHQASWSENAWAVYAKCLENKHNFTQAAQVAERGIRYYPASEVLYNLAGQNEIMLGQFPRAITVLKAGLHSVPHQTNGVMANNLAWAGLWVPHSLRIESSRALYQNALTFNRSSCEILHTGLWVEYSAATHSGGIAQAMALRNFQNLRARYQTCQNATQDGDWETLVAVTGASVLFEKIDHLLNTSSATRMHNQGAQSLLSVSEQLRKHFRGSSINALCEQAMPLASTRQDCVQAISQSIRTLRDQEAASMIERTKYHRRTHCRFAHQQPEGSVAR